MPNFKVNFTELDKTVTIPASDAFQAEEWATRQLDAWGKESNFYVLGVAEFIGEFLHDSSKWDSSALAPIIIDKDGEHCG